MSLSCVTNYLSAHFGHLQATLANGSCRVLSQDDGELADAQGYPSSGYTPRTEAFLPCSWTAKKIDEKLIAGQTRELGGYEITLAQNNAGSPVVVKASDRLELRLKTGEVEAVELEIIAVLNQSGAAWTIYALDIDDR